MEKKVIRVGSVGVGAIWGGVHEPGIAKSPDLTLVAICDIDEKKARSRWREVWDSSAVPFYGLSRFG